MIIKLFYLFALFPFLHTTSYPAEVVSCKPNDIVVKSEGSTFRISLFNTSITDEAGWNQACALLDDAESIHFEIDPSSKVQEPIPVYLFADDTLVQEAVMKQGYAYPMIRNPEYIYEKRLEAAYDTTQTMAKPAKEKAEHRAAFVGPLYYGITLLLWGGMLLYMIIQKKRKKQTK